MDENPYAKFGAPVVEDNPYARFAVPAAQPAPAEAGLKGNMLEKGVALTLGAPVDAVNGLLKAVGLPMSDTPFLGSRNINDVMTSGNKNYGPVAAVANGISFGTLPNIQAGTVAAANTVANIVGLGDGQSASDTYDAVLKQQQDARREYRDRRPLTSAVLEGVGGAATGGALAKGGVTLVGRIPNQGLGNLLQRSLAGGVEGAAYGAAAGFGGGEGSVDNRLEGAKDNLFLGALLGIAAPGVVDAASSGGRVLKDIYTGVMNKNPQGHADDLLVRALMRGKTTPEAVGAEVRAAGAAGQPEFVTADALGRNGQRTLKLAARTPGEFRDTAASFAADRQAGQSSRLGKYVDDLTGQTADDAFKTEQAIIAERRAAADPAYDAAYAAPAPTDPFFTKELLQKRSVQDAIPGAERLAAEKQVPLTDLFAEVKNPNATTVTKQVPSAVLGPDGNPVTTTVTEVTDPTLRVPTVRGWDYIKRSLDADVNKLYSNSAVEAPAVKETRNMLRDRLGADVPAYGEALKKYADDSALLDALNVGRDAAKANGMALDAAEAALKGLTPEQQALARLGFARETKGGMTAADTTGRDMSRRFSSTDAQRKTAMMAESPEAADAFSQRVGREQAMVRTHRTLGGGSDTAENIGDAADAVNSGFITALLSGRPFVAAGRGMEALARRASGINEDVAKRIGDILLSNDPAKIENLADLFRRAQAAQSAPSLAPSVINAGANAPRQKSGKDKP